MNLWRASEVIQQIVFSKRLASIAAGLMQVDGVRLYHDQALYKEARGNEKEHFIGWLRRPMRWRNHRTA